jgi:hypothetical protein
MKTVRNSRMRFKLAKSGRPLSVSTLCSAVEKLLASMTVLRKGSTANRATQILLIILPFAIEVHQGWHHRLPCLLEEARQQQPHAQQ